MKPANAAFQPIYTMWYEPSIESNYQHRMRLGSKTGMRSKRDKHLPSIHFLEDSVPTFLRTRVRHGMIE